MPKIKLGFAPDVLLLQLSDILPSRMMPAAVHGSVKFNQILRSIKDVGIIEPLSVCQLSQGCGQYMLLDGHARLLALKELGFEKAPCLLAVDDEAYTYNTRINRLSTIQEVRMLQEAVAKGVSKEHLARALNVNISNLLKKLKILDGICPEAAELLKDRQFSIDVSRMLRKMKATRQVESIELMLSANCLTANYAQALLAATPVEMLVDGAKAEIKGITAEQMVKMEREMGNLQGQYKLIEESYAEDILNLVLAQGYLAKLMSNDEVKRYIKNQSPDIFEQLEKTVGMGSLEQ